MDRTKADPDIQALLEELDRLIVRMAALRGQVAALEDRVPSSQGSIREAESFGMWAGREDMKGLTSREWLECQRMDHWKR